jgi:hypothetical protein
LADDGSWIANGYPPNRDTAIVVSQLHSLRDVPYMEAKSAPNALLDSTQEQMQPQPKIDPAEERSRAG